MIAVWIKLQSPWSKIGSNCRAIDADLDKIMELLTMCGVELMDGAIDNLAQKINFWGFLALTL